MYIQKQYPCWDESDVEYVRNTWHDVRLFFNDAAAIVAMFGA